MTTVFAWLQRIYNLIGPIGALALALIAGAAIFLVSVLHPLERRLEQVDQRLAGNERRNSAASDPANASARQLTAFYRFFETKQSANETLSKLHDLSSKNGVELRAADYRVQKSGTRLERYEIALPINGNYSQIRTFLETALVEIPTLSLDQLSFRRQNATDPAVQADVHLTLYSLAP